MSRRVLLFSILLLALPLAGCAAPDEGDGGTGENPDETPPLESAACGFRIDVPQGWMRVGTNGTGFFLLSAPPSSGTAETIGVQVADGALMEEARAATENGTWEAGGGLLVGATIVGSGNHTLDGREALLVEVEGHQGTVEVAWNVALAPHGNRTVLLLWGAEKGETPSGALTAAVDSFRLTGDPTPACGGQQDVTGGDAEGWISHDNLEAGWSMRHPGTWRALPLSDTGEAIVFSAENETGYSPSFMVISQAMPEDEEATLDELADEMVRQIRQRKDSFRLTSDEASTLGGEAARRIESTEDHGGEAVRGLRVMSLHEGRLVYLEILFRADDATFQADAEAALASFRFTG